MKLFKVTLSPVDYDTYDSAVIACESREALIEVFKNKRFSCGRFGNDPGILYQADFSSHIYCPQKVESIVEIGESTIDYGRYDAVVICSSYNAG